MISSYTNYVISFFICLGVLFQILGLSTPDTPRGEEMEDMYRQLNTYVVWLFAVELTVRFIAFGKSFLYDRFYILDSIAIILACLASPPTNIFSDDIVQHHLRGFELGYFFRILRLVRVFRLLSLRDRYRVILETSAIVFYNFLMLWAMAFCLDYVFAVLGMEAFHGVITKKIALHMAEKPGELGQWWQLSIVDTLYYGNNMDTFFRAMIVCLELTVVNQWHVITRMYVEAMRMMGYPEFWTYLYFYSYYMCSVVVIVNVLTAVVVDAFVLQRSLGDSDTQYRWEANVIDGLELIHGIRAARSLRIRRYESKALLYSRLYGGEQECEDELTDIMRQQSSKGGLNVNETIFSEHASFSKRRR